MMCAGFINFNNKGVKFLVAFVLVVSLCFSCLFPFQRASGDLVITPGIIALGAIVGAFGFSLMNPSQTGDALNTLYDRLSFPTQEYLGRLVRTGHFIRLGIDGASAAISEIADVVQELFSNDIPGSSGGDTPIYNISDLVYTDNYLLTFTDVNYVGNGGLSNRYEISFNSRYAKKGEVPYQTEIDYINSLPLTYLDIHNNDYTIEDNGYTIQLGWNGAIYRLQFEGSSWFYNANPNEIALGVVSTPSGSRLAVTWDNRIWEMNSDYNYFSMHVIAPDISLSFDDRPNTDVIGVFLPPGVIQQDVINRALKELADNPDISIPVPETDTIDDVIPGSQAEALENFYDIPIEDVGTAVPGASVNPLNPSTFLPPGTLVEIPTVPQLRDFFPFCIPFDFVDLIRLFESSREAPHFHISWHIPIVNVQYEFDADWSDWDGVASIARSLQLLLYAVFLMLVTARFIKW